MTPTAKRNILAVLAATLVVLAAIAAIYFAITLTNGGLSSESASSEKLVDLPPRMMPPAGQSQNDLSELRPFADRVKLAAVAGGPSDPDIALVPNGKAVKRSPFPTQLVQVGGNPVTFGKSAGAQATLVPLNPSPALATALQSSGSGEPATALITSGSPTIDPATLALNSNSSADLPDTVAPSGNSAPTAMDIAIHPSLKYGAYVGTADLAFIRSNAAFDVPVSGFGRKAAAWAKAINAASRPAAAQAAATGDHADLIRFNLQLENARRFIMSMCQDQQGRLWVGTKDGGVQRFDPVAPELRQWTQFTTKDGLGDNNGYAVACDRLGRIWVGHLSHGVSVFNGVGWQNYDGAGDAAPAAQPRGPLGETVSAIKTCPVDGDVWMATSAGIARYSMVHDTWSYYTRADGLPSNEVKTLAFDSSGDVYAATLGGGIEVAGVTDNYDSWKVLSSSGPRAQILHRSGILAEDTNGILVSARNALVVATDSGLYWSDNHAQTWSLIEGQNRVRENAVSNVINSDRDRSCFPILLEDSVTCVAELPDGNLIVGHRQQSCEDVNLAAHREDSRLQPSFYGKAHGVTAICLLRGGGALVGTLGSGLVATSSASSASVESANATFSAPMPAGAKPYSLDAFLKRMAMVKARGRTASLKVAPRQNQPYPYGETDPTGGQDDSAQGPVRTRARGISVLAGGTFGADRSSDGPQRRAGNRAIGRRFNRSETSFKRFHVQKIPSHAATLLGSGMCLGGGVYTCSVDVPAAVLEAAALLAAQGQGASQIAQNLLNEFGDQGYNLTQVANDAISSNEGDEVAETAQTALQAAKDAATQALNNFPADVLNKINNFIRTITANTNCPGAPPAGITKAQLQAYLSSLQAAVAVVVSNGNTPTAIATNRIAQLQNIIQNMP